MDNKDSKKYYGQSSTHKYSENDFICRHCGRKVGGETPGAVHRNHCPYCLRSLHLDNQTGDRASPCGGIMEPVAISVRRGGEWVIIHRCTVCGTLRENRIAGDDNEIALLSLAVRPVAQPPFPLDGLKSEHFDEIKGEK
jgi:hypothetical protein